MPKVTVIMPSLNVVKYIRPCIESVLAQTLSDMEILAIDAGSEDGTLQIIEEYALRDKRIKVIHSDKKSYGYQLNLGIALAQGDYIGIVETDDMIVFDMYEVLFDTAIKTDADYVKGGFQKFVDLGDGYCWSDSGHFPFENTEIFGKVIEPCNMSSILIKDIYLWSGIYERKFISNIKLNETHGAAFQDQGFLFQTISSAKKAVYLDKVVYKYRQDNTKSSIYNKKGFNYIAKEYDYIEYFLAGKDESWTRAYYVRMLNQCIGRFEMMAVSGEFWEEALPVIQVLREKLWKAVEEKLLTSKDMDSQRWKLLELFLKGERYIYAHCRDEIYLKAKPIDNVVRAVDYHSAIIFGCGKLGKFLHALLESRYPGKVVAYCDNNSKLWNTRLQGMMIISLEEALQRYPDAVYVIANLKEYETIKHQIQALGVPDIRICSYQGPVNMLLFHI